MIIHFTFAQHKGSSLNLALQMSGLTWQHSSWEWHYYIIIIAAFFLIEFWDKIEHNYQFQSDLQHTNNLSLTLLPFVCSSFVQEF